MDHGNHLKDWLNRLHESLRQNGLHDTSLILNHYSQLYESQTALKKPPTEIISEFGDPKVVAQAHLIEASAIKTQGRQKDPDLGAVFGATLRMIVLLPLNFFMFLGPFLVLAIGLIAAWSAAILMLGLCLAGVPISFVGLIFIFGNFWLGCAILTGVLALWCFSVFAILTLFLLTKFSFSAIYSFLQWNIRFVLSERGNHI